MAPLYYTREGRRAHETFFVAQSSSSAGRHLSPRCRATNWSPCFQGIPRTPLHTGALSSPGVFGPLQENPSPIGKVFIWRNVRNAQLDNVVAGFSNQPRRRTAPTSVPSEILILTSSIDCVLGLVRSSEQVGPGRVGRHERYCVTGSWYFWVGLAVPGERASAQEYLERATAVAGARVSEHDRFPLSSGDTVFSRAGV